MGAEHRGSEDLLGAVLHSSRRGVVGAVQVAEGVGAVRPPGLTLRRGEEFAVVW